MVVLIVEKLINSNSKYHRSHYNHTLCTQIDPKLKVRELTNQNTRKSKKNIIKIPPAQGHEFEFS